MKKTLTIIAAALLAFSAPAQQLSEEQKGQLENLSTEYIQQAAMFQSLIRDKLTDLALELQREGRLDDEAEAEKSSGRVNKILKELSGLYGEFIRTKVQIILDAKNVLTDEQKMQMLAQLKPNASVPYQNIEYLQPDLFDLPLNLSIEQQKKLIELEARLNMSEVKVERDVALTLLDLQTALFYATPDAAKTDPLILQLADLAALALDNRINYFIAAKDVLSLDQKRLLIYLMGVD